MAARSCGEACGEEKKDDGSKAALQQIVKNTKATADSTGRTAANTATANGHLGSIAGSTKTTAGNTGEIAGHTGSIDKKVGVVSDNYYYSKFDVLVGKAEKSTGQKMQTCQYDHLRPEYLKACRAGDCKDRDALEGMVDLLKESKSTRFYAHRFGIKVKADACWKTVDEAKSQKDVYKLMKEDHRNIYNALRGVKSGMKAWTKYVEGIDHDEPTVRADIERMKREYGRILADRASRGGYAGGSGSGHSGSGSFRPTTVGDGMMPSIGGSAPPGGYSPSPMGAPSIGHVRPPTAGMRPSTGYVAPPAMSPPRPAARPAPRPRPASTGAHI